MHEVELIKRVRTQLRSAVDIDMQANPNARVPGEETLRRVVLATLEILGIRIGPDGQLAATPTDRDLRQAALINAALANGYTPTGFGPADHAMAAKLRREARSAAKLVPAGPSTTSHTEHTFVFGFCHCGEPEAP